MDKTVIFAVAGSGKTTKLITSLDLERRFLVLTYTDANRDNIERKIIKKFGFFPENVYLYTYFTFLHAFCYKPFLQMEKKTVGVTFSQPPIFTSRLSLTDERRFISEDGRLFHGRIAKYLELNRVTDHVIARVEKYFDAIYVDEVQDLAGHDFNFLMTLCQSKVSMIMVGDFYQHTYDTSRDGSVNASLHEDYEKYQSRFRTAKVNVDMTSLSKSHRCSIAVCDFIRTKFGIEIYSNSEVDATVRFTEQKSDIEALYHCNHTVKLFYDEHYKYSCLAQNWGGSKGQDHYENVCVALNKSTLQAWNAGNFGSIKPATKNKLYVACSRARNNLTLVPEAMLAMYKSG